MEINIVVTLDKREQAARVHLQVEPLDGVEVSEPAREIDRFDDWWHSATPLAGQLSSSACEPRR